MIGAPPPEGDDGSLARLGRLIEACGRFEEAWGRGARPRIEDYWSGAPGGDADEWLRRLLSLEFSLRRERGEAIVLGEYHARFPGRASAVDAALGEQTEAPGPLPEPGPAPRPSPGAAHGLLLGILALQNGFIDHRALIGAVRTWAADKGQSIGSLLAASGHLDAGRLALLEALVGEHRKLHGDDLQKSLAGMGSIESVRRTLENEADPDVQSSLAGIRPTGSADGPGEPTATWDGGAQGEANAEGPLHGGRYRLIGFHAAGNLGRVSIARDQELRRQVAFKEIREDLSDHATSRQQFLLEALVTGGLEHPGIVPVYGLGSQEDGRPFYAMKFIRGPSLRDKLRQLHGHESAPIEDDPPTLPKLLRHFISACHALAYAHSRGVLHRDIKPEHVMLGPYGETLVVDWGLAMPFRAGSRSARSEEGTLRLPEDVGSALSRDGVLVGTVHYMGPEQARGLHSQLDQRSDIYSLGATLYCLLTGSSPHKGRDPVTALEKVKAGDFPRPRQVKPAVPAALEAICLKAMRPLPEDRYTTATELARDLERWLDDEPTTAYREPWRDRAARWVRRHRTAAVGATTLLAASCLALGAGNVLIRDKNRQLAAANREIEQQFIRAEESGEEARANFDRARRLVHDMLYRVAHSDLPRVPGADGMRVKVAADASAYLSEMMQGKPSDPGVRFDAARSYRELGKALQVVGRPEAVPSFVEAIKILTALTKELPGEPSYFDYLAETLMDGGAAHRMKGASAKAGPFYRRALEISQQLRALDPGDARYRRTRFGALYNAAAHHADIGDLEESVRLSREAIALLTPLADGVDSGPLDSLRLAMALADAGDTLLELGRKSEARPLLDESLRRVERILVARSDDRDAHYIQAVALLTKGRLDDSEADLDGAVECLAKLSLESPEVAHYRARWADALTARGEFFEAARRHLPAADDSRAAAEILGKLLHESPGHPIHSGQLGRVFGGLGRLAFDRGAPAEAKSFLTQAITLQEVALKANPGSPPDLRLLELHRSELAQIAPP